MNDNVVVVDNVDVSVDVMFLHSNPSEKDGEEKMMGPTALVGRGIRSFDQHRLRNTTFVLFLELLPLHFCFKELLIKWEIPVIFLCIALRN